MVKIQVQTLANKKYPLDVPESETIGALKQKIADELKLGDVEEQKLIYLGKILSKNEQTIASVGVKDGGVLVLMISKIKKPAAAAAAPAAAADASSAPAAAAAGSPAAAAAAPTPAAATAAPTPAEQPAPAPAPAVGGAATPPAAAAGSPPAAGAPAPAPAAAGAPASAPAPAVAAESSLAMGAGLEPVVNDLMALGFPRDQVQAALRAAYNNADRAADYLFNGIPDHVMQQMAQAPRAPAAGHGGAPPSGAPQAGSGSPPQQQQPPAEQGGGGAPNAHADALAGLMAGSGGGVNPNNPLAALGNSPQFQQMRAILQQQPDLIPMLLQQLAQSQPQLAQLIAQNPEALADLLAGGGGGGGGGGAPQGGQGGGGGGPRSHTVQITMEEKAQLDRLEALGFSRQRALEAWLLCDRNEELAANFLFENNDGSDAQGQ